MTRRFTPAGKSRVPAEDDDQCRFRVEEGLLGDWDDLVSGTSGSFRERWIRLAQHRLPGPFYSFCLSAHGATQFAMVGGVMPAPTGHVRFDPYRILSGGSAAEGVAEDGPHPWREHSDTRIFPCLLMMFPGYETAPVGAWARDEGAAAVFLTGLRRWATTQQIKSIAFLFVRGDYPEFLAALSHAGFDVTAMANRGDLEIAWDDFEGYVAWLPRKRRFTVRREIRDIAGRGVVVRERPLAADEPELIALRNQLVEKYGGVPDQQREIDTVRLLREQFGPGDVLVVEAVKDGRPLAFAVFIRDGDVWTSLMSGADYTREESVFTYFAVMFYRPAALAPVLGISKIVYGLGTLEAKRLRGCTMTGLWAAGSLVGD